MQVSVIIPAFNEADRIGRTIAAAKALPGVSEVIVVDDGSADATAEAACETGVAVIRQPRNRGKAKALEVGFREASGDLLLLLDADLCETAREAAVLAAPVAAGEADMTIAKFPVVPGRGGGRGIVVRLARAGIQRATGRALSAPLSGQRCLTRAAFLAALPFARGFGIEVGLSIDVLRAGFRVVEIETQMDHRVTQNDWRAQRHRIRQLRDVVLALAPRLVGASVKRSKRTA